MGEQTGIEWCHHTWNPWVGCAKVSPGCAHCYAEHDTPARYSRSQGVELWGKNAARRVKAESGWNEPLRWDRAAAKAGERRRVFCASQADVFEDREDLTEALSRLWQIILYSDHLDWLLLTKRPENVIKRLKAVWDFQKARLLRDGCLEAWIDGSIPPANVWLGVSCENQKYADERIPLLLQTPAAVRFVSAEPLLGPIDFNRIESLCETWRRGITIGTYLDWIIVGGESGPNARPCDVANVRWIVRQCQATKTACFVKQLGSDPVQPVNVDGVIGTIGYPFIGQLRDKKGGDPAEWPEDVRVREFPNTSRLGG